MLTLLTLVTLVQAPLAPAHLHPAGLDVYVEIPNVGEFAGLARTAPIGKLAHDAQFLDAIVAMLRQPELDRAALSAQLDEGLGRALGAIGLPADVLNDATLSMSINGLRSSLPDAVQRTAQWSAARAQLQELSQQVQNQTAPPATLAELPDSGGEAPRDPWGHALVYSVDPTTQQFSLTSLGADGEPGGELDATDVTVDANVMEVATALASDAFGVTVALRLASEAHANTLFEALVASLASSVELGAPGAVGERAFRVAEFPAWVDVEGSTLLLGQGNVMHADVLARTRGDGRNPAGARSVLESAHARLGEPRDRVVWLGYQAAGWLDLIGGFAGALGSLGSADGASPLTSLIDMLPSTGTEPKSPSESAWRTEFDGKQFRALSVEPAPTSGFGALLGRTPFDAAVLQTIPATANAFWVTSIDGPATGKQLFTLLGQQNGHSAAEWLASIERTANVRLDKALFDNLGGTATVYAMPWKAIGLPPVVAVVPLRDPALFSASIEHLGALLPDSLVESGAKVNTRPYRDTAITTLSLGDSTGGLPIPIQPALCVLDGQLLISTSPTPLKDEIKRRKDAKGELHAAVAASQKELGGASSTLYVDYVAILSDVLAIATNAAKMIGGDSLPIDLSKLPKRELLEKYFAPTTSRTELRDGWAYTTARGSFGPETPLFLAAAMFAVGELVERRLVNATRVDGAAEASDGAVDAAPVPATPPPAEVTSVALRQVRGALAVYKNDTGKYASTLGDLTVGSANYPSGYLASGSVPNDGWGQALRYELTENGARYRLWSIGADGMDQSGAGDDVNAQPVR
jgi:hypothetical protein